MDMMPMEAASRIRLARPALVDTALAALGAEGSRGAEKAREDLAWHFDFLAEAVEFDEAPIFTHYLEWLSTLFERLSLPPGSLERTLDCLRLGLSALPPGGGRESALAVLETAIRARGSGPPRWSRSQPALAAGVAQDYLEELLEGKRGEALALVEGLLHEGLGLPMIYLDIIQPAQRELGRLWLLGEIDTSQEHLCSASTQFIMARLCPSVLPGARPGHRVVAAAVGGELHDIGLRMVSDLLELQGWESYYLGANSPGSDIVRAVMEWKPDILCLSATLPCHLSRVARVIDQVRDAFPLKTPGILVGGLAFEESPRLWKAVGADAWGRDAHEALGLAAGQVA